MKIGIIGSREFKDQNFVVQTVTRLCHSFMKNNESLMVISGGARGVDSWAVAVSRGWIPQGVKTLIFPAKWDDLSHPNAVIKTRRDGSKYDALAGFRRNSLIVDEAEKLIVFWDGSSSGTKDTFEKAIKKGIPVDIYVRR